MKNLRILIIDTDLFSLSKIYFGLIHLEHAVEACNNLQEVEERVERFQPGIVILGNTGPCDTEALSRYLKVLGVHLLFMGTSPEGADPDDVLERPVDVSLLRHRISALAMEQR